jgi:Protein of unknown function (DUF1153)
MGQMQQHSARAAAGAYNDYRTGDALPPPRSNHWVARQKRAVVAAVNAGVLPLNEAMQRYELSIEEFVSWECAFNREPSPHAVLEQVH